MPIFEMSMDELKRYNGISPKPIDFDEYWERALEDVAQTGLSFQMFESDFKVPNVKCYDLWFTGVDDAKIHCKFLRPSKISGTIPSVIIFHGYMHHSGEWFLHLPYAYAGKAVIVMDVRGQGGLSQDTCTANGPSMFGHIVRGVDDPNPDKLFYRNIYLDAVKTARILMSMNFIDSARIGVTGKSQGGALALICASLVPEIKLVAPIYPFLSDFKRIVEMDLNQGAYEGLYYYFKKYDPLHEGEKAFFNRLGYIDIQNFMSRLKACVLWQTGLMDRTCPPSTQYAAYNKIVSQKSIKLYPEHDHELLTYANDYIFQFFSNL